MCGWEAGGATMLRRVKFGLTYTYVYVRTKYTFVYFSVFTSFLTMGTMRESNPANLFAENSYSPPKLAISAHRISPYKHTNKICWLIALPYNWQTAVDKIRQCRWECPLCRVLVRWRYLCTYLWLWLAVRGRNLLRPRADSHCMLQEQESQSSFFFCMMRCNSSSSEEE